MLYNLHFFSSKYRLFHNATLFSFCITHILNTECAKIWRKKIRRQKVKSCLPLLPWFFSYTKHYATVRQSCDILYSRFDQSWSLRIPDLGC